MMRLAGASLPLRALRSIASSAPTGVFALPGRAAPAAPIDLLKLDDITLADSPRGAGVLLVLGELPPSLHDAARHIHDQIPHPRRTVLWHTDVGAPGDAPFRGAVTYTGTLDTLAPALRAALATRPSEPDLLPDTDPAPWRGVGPYGQGGTGMTGGVPYGRPMASTAPDIRDGLALDRLMIRAGPFLPPLPPGLTLQLHLQGDVIQEVSVAENPFAGAPPRARDPWRTALDRPMPIRDLEVARARHHMRWIAHALRSAGLDALAIRAIDLAFTLTMDHRGEVARLARALEGSRSLALATADVATIAPADVADLGLGPIARASGIAEDLRASDPAYLGAGFEPVTHDGGDTRARWRQRLHEAVASLTIAARAGNATTGGTGTIEGPRGPITLGTTPAAPALALLPALLRGMELGDAMMAVVSLDIDLMDAA